MQGAMGLPLKQADSTFTALDPLLIPESMKSEIVLHDIFPLFQGTPLEQFADTAPVLMQRTPESDIFFQEKYQALAVLLMSPLSLRQLYDHLHQLMFTTRYDDRNLVIRIYDPYVMHTFGSTFDEKSKAHFFKGITKVIYTGPDRVRYEKSK